MPVGVAAEGCGASCFRAEMTTPPIRATDWSYSSITEPDLALCSLPSSVSRFRNLILEYLISPSIFNLSTVHLSLAVCGQMSNC